MAVWNECQTSESLLGLDECNSDVLDEFWGFMDTVPLIKWMIRSDRPRARDLERDEEGRILIDVTRPHILEDMDYFRPAAIHFQETGRYCDYTPNPNPSSEFGKWFDEETRRCLEGYVRESDGEWITGDHYFFLNYFMIRQNRRVGAKSRMAEIFTDFPKMWDGHYLWFHYLHSSRLEGCHSTMLASRARGKSYCSASMLLRRLVVGESIGVTKNIHSVVTASNEIYLNTADRILPMFMKGLEHCRANTQFRSSMLRESLSDMTWEAGYTDNEIGKRGSHNTVTGISSKDAGRLRGSRAALVVFEEMGNFPSLLEAFNKDRPLVEDGENVFGQMVLIGTTGDKESDFASIQEIMYSPHGYNMLPLPNVYDKEGTGRKEFVYFFPSYLDYSNSYDKDGNSDVTKALLSICKSRDIIRKKTNDPSTISSTMAENPVTPQEAIIRSVRNIFPVADINARIAELDANPREYDDVWAGTLVMDSKGEVSYAPSGNVPIRDFPLKGSDYAGAVEIYSMPQKTSDGRVPFGRYVVGVDPVDNDSASDSVSLFSCFAFDLFTDSIAAEYTGRTDAEKCYETARLMTLFYNTQCLYENNIKGLFAYFSKMNSLHLLADTPDYLKDRQIIKLNSGGFNTTKGVRATSAVNAFANELIVKWLGTPRTAFRPDGTVTLTNLKFIRNRALLKELSLYSPVINVDRIRALGMVMIMREEKLIVTGGDISSCASETRDGYMGDDDFFKDNYDRKFVADDDWKKSAWF